MKCVQHLLIKLQLLADQSISQGNILAGMFFFNMAWNQHTLTLPHRKLPAETARPNRSIQAGTRHVMTQSAGWCTDVASSKVSSCISLPSLSSMHKTKKKSDFHFWRFGWISSIFVPSTAELCNILPHYPYSLTLLHFTLEARAARPKMWPIQSR
jgi:hypothetical protein